MRLMVRLLALVSPLVLLIPIAARADQFSSQVEALHAIRDTATSLCESVGQSGSATRESVSGKVGVQLPGITKKLLDLGVEGAGKLEDDQYQGVVRDQLADVIKHTTDCRKGVFDKLINVLIPPSPKMQESSVHGPISFELEKCEPALSTIQCTLVVSVSRPGKLMLIGNMPRDGLESQLIPDNSHIPYPASVSMDVAHENFFAMDKIQVGIPRKVYVTVQNLPSDAEAGHLTVAFTFDQQPERATFHISLRGD